MTPQEIQIGTRLELDLLNKNSEKSGSTYISQLLEHQESSTMVISAPIFEARLIYIPLEAQLRLVFLQHKYGLLGFTATVIRREFKGNIAVLVVRPESDLVRIQRRGNYRLDYTTDILIWLGRRDTKADRKSAIKSITKNISGSGIGIITDVDIPKSTEVDIELSLAENIIITAKCIVVRNNLIEVKKGKCYELGLNFTKISPKDQDHLIKYIFEQQRLHMKKESQ